MKRLRPAIIVVVALAVLLVAGRAADPMTNLGAAPLAAPSLSVNPTQGQAGGAVTLTGNGFSSGSYQDTILWDDEPQDTFDVPPSGSFTLPFTIPPGASPGIHTITVCAGDPCFTGEFEQKASATFEVLPPDQGAAECGTYGDHLEPYPAAGVTLDPDSGPPGSSLEVGLTNVEPNDYDDQPAEVLWDWTPGSGGELIGSGVVPAFETSVGLEAEVLGDAEPGYHSVTVCWYYSLAETWYYKHAEFHVTAPTPGETPTPIPSTTPVPPPAGTLAVNTTSDHDDGHCEPRTTGDCTLREAIRSANERAGADTILFDIPSSDSGYDSDSHTWTITPGSNLPALTDDGTTIDAIAEVGAAGSNQLRAASLCSSPEIIIDVRHAFVGLYLLASDSQIRGLAITRANGYGVWIQGPNAENNLLACNHIIDNGSAASGTGGVRIGDGASGNRIGSSGEGNLISGNEGPGVWIIGPDTAENYIEGNYIGTDASGNSAYGNGYNGVLIQSAHDNRILSNVISGNSHHGVYLTSHTNENEVENNYIGTRADGAEGLGNGLSGVSIDLGSSDNIIGPDNTITSSPTGVQVSGPTSLRNTVTWSSIYANMSMAIDNEAGGNSELQPPTLSVTASGLSGTSDCPHCTVEMFSDSATPAQAREAMDIVETDANGNWSWPSAPAAGQDYVATVTDNSGNTSELSAVGTAYYFEGSLSYFASDDMIVDASFELVGSNPAEGEADAAGTEEVLATADTQHDGTFVLAHRPTDQAYHHYTIRLADPRYTLTGAESGSGGEVTEDSAIRFADIAPGVYDENAFFARDFEEPLPDQVSRSFRGHVYHGESGDRSEPLPGVVVELFGSWTGDQRGEPVARTQTGLDGMFYLANWAYEEAHYPYYSLMLTHPGAEITGVEPGEGGEARDETWVVFPQPPASDALTLSQVGAQTNGTELDEGGDVRDVKAVSTPTPTPKASVDTEWFIGNRLERAPLDAIGPIPAWSKKPDKTSELPLKPEPIDFKVDGVELTQAIQCFDTSEGDKNCPDNSLPLVAGKLTVARVYISRVAPSISGGSEQFESWKRSQKQYPKVRVDLSVANSGVTASGAFTAVGLISQQFVVPLDWDREDAKTTADFLIPAPKAGKLSASASVNVDAKWPDPNPNNNESGLTSAQVLNTRPVKITWIRMNYKPQGSKKYPKSPFNGSSSASASWVTNAASPISWIFPTPKLNYFKHGTGITDYYFEISGKKYTPDIRDDFQWYGNTYTVMYAFMVNRLYDITGSKPSYDTLFAWFPKGAMNQHDTKGLAEGAPPVTSSGDGRAALSVQPRTHLLPHEIGHNFGLGHFPCFLNTQGSDHNWPAPYNDCTAVEVPFNPVKMDVPGLYSFMTYNVSDENSISPPEWKHLVNELKTSDPYTAAAVEAAEESSHLIVSGWLDSEGEGELDPIYMLEGSPELPAASEGALGEILFLDSEGIPLGGHVFNVEDGPSDGDGGDIAQAAAGAFFAFQLPQPDGLDRVQLLYNGSVVAERWPSDNPPDIELLSPQTGGELSGAVSVTWDASDPDDDPLTYLVFYSHDGGVTWMPLATNLTDLEYELDTAQVPGCEACLVRVVVTDGWHTREAVSGTLAVAQKAPEVTIGTPADNSAVWPEQALVLRGLAHDPEDGPLPDGALSWSSDRDGLLGQGETLVLPGLTLSPGEHQISFTATDSDGGVGTATATLHVGVDLVPGWNTKCYLGEQVPTEDALAGISGGVQAVYRLSGGQTFERWFPGRAEVSNITTIRPYEPLIILLAANAAWEQVPAGTHPTSVDLAQGWNSVCYLGQDRDAESATQGIASQLALLYTLGMDQTWGRYVPGRPDVSNIARLEQYDAVLTLVTESAGTTWTFGP